MSDEMKAEQAALLKKQEEVLAEAMKHPARLQLQVEAAPAEGGQQCVAESTLDARHPALALALVSEALQELVGIAAFSASAIKNTSIEEVADPDARKQMYAVALEHLASLKGQIISRIYKAVDEGKDPLAHAYGISEDPQTSEVAHD